MSMGSSLPSAKARTQAAARLFKANVAPRVDSLAADMALEAAHDPALGLDRSVCLRDVTEFIERVLGAPIAAKRIEKRFTEGGDCG